MDAAAPAVTSRATPGGGGGESAGVAGYPRLSWIVAIVVPCLVAAAFIALWFYRFSPGGLGDLATYQRGSSMVLAGQSPYAPWQLSGPFQLPDAAAGAGYVYPPSAAVVMAPFVANALVWTALNLVVFGVGMLAAVRVERPLTPKLTLAVLLAGALHPGLGQSVFVGAVTPLLTGLLGLVYAGASPALSAAAGLMKVFPGVWLAWELRHPRWRQIALAAGFTAAIMLVSIALVGLNGWRDYFTMLGNAEPSCREIATLRCFGLPTVAAYGIAVAMAVVAIVTPRRVAFTLMAGTVWVAAPDLGLHYGLFLLPPLLVLLARR